MAEPYRTGRPRIFLEVTVDWSGLRFMKPVCGGGVMACSFSAPPDCRFYSKRSSAALQVLKLCEEQETCTSDTMSDTVEQYPAAGGANTAAAGAIPAAPLNPGYPGHPVNSDTLNPAAGGANAAAPNPGYLVNCDTPFGNLSFSLSGWERVVFMIFVALCILVSVAYMIKKLVEDGEGKK